MESILILWNGLFLAQEDDSNALIADYQFFKSFQGIVFYDMNCEVIGQYFEEFRESLPDIILGYELVLIFDCNQRRTILI